MATVSLEFLAFLLMAMLNCGPMKTVGTAVRAIHGPLQLEIQPSMPDLVHMMYVYVGKTVIARRSGPQYCCNVSPLRFRVSSVRDWWVHFKEVDSTVPAVQYPLMFTAAH